MRAFLLPATLLLLAAPATLAAQQPSDPMPVQSVEQPPVLLDSACLWGAHPDILRQAGIEGRVLVGFVVDTAGAVDSTQVRVLSSTHRLFERPARAAVLTCRFRPGRQSGRAVGVRMELPLNFVLPAPPPRGGR